MGEVPGRKIGVNLEILGTGAWGLKISSVKYTEALEREGVSCIKFSGKRGSGTFDKLFRMVELLWFVSSKKVEVLYSPTHHGLFLPLVPQVVTLFDLQPLVFAHRSTSQRFYFRWILPMVLKGCSWVVMGSHFTRLEAIKTYHLREDRTKVVYVGSPLGDDGRETGDGRGCFLVVGAGLPHKNLEVILEALDHPLARDWKVTVVSGDSPYLKTIKEKAIEKGLVDQLEVKKGIPQEELKSLYLQAQALLFPSLYEGFGMPLLEAMTLGCPAIAAKGSALWEVGSRAPLYAHPEKGAEWREKMGTVKENPALRRRLEVLGKRRAKDFSWERAGSQLKELIFV